MACTTGDPEGYFLCGGDSGGTVGLPGGTVPGAESGFTDWLFGGIGRIVQSGITGWAYWPPSLDLSEGPSKGRNWGETQPGGLDGIETVLGYMTWVGLAVCVAGLLIAGAKIGLGFRTIEDGEPYTRVGNVLLGTVVLGAGTSIVGMLFGSPPTGSAHATVAFLRNSVWWYALCLAVVGVIVAGIKMAWEQRAEPGKDLVRSLITMVVVTGLAIPTIGSLSTAADNFTIWILESSAQCDDGDNSCPGQAFSTLALVGLGTGKVAEEILRHHDVGKERFWVYFLPIILIFVSVLIQWILLLGRMGILVIIAGLLPLAAAGSTTEMGQAWLKRSIGWLFAWLLYKPVVAIIYAAGIHLMGSDIFDVAGIFTAADDDLFDMQGLVSMLVGLTIMVLAIVALPALLQLVAAPAEAVASDPAGALGSGVAGWGQSLATGAIARGGRGRGQAPPTSPSQGEETEQPQGATATGGTGTRSGSGGGAGNAPPGSTPPDDTPPDDTPSGDRPSGNRRPGIIGRPGIRRSGNRRPRNASSGGGDGGSTPPGITPPGGTPPGITPPGGTPPGITPPGGTPPGITPPGGTPPGITPPGITPPGSTGGRR